MFVSPVISYPINRGSAHRTDQMIRALLDNDCKITLLLLNQSEEKTTSIDLKKRLEGYYNNANLSVEVRKHPNFNKPKDKVGIWRRKLKNWWEKILYRDALINSDAGLPKNFKKLIQQYFDSGAYDYAWFNYMKIKPSGLKSKNTKIIVDMHDMQVTRIKADVLPEISSVRRNKYLATFTASEKKELDNCDIAISISPVETESIQQVYQPKTAQVVTLKATDDVRFVGAHQHQFDLAFIGSNSNPNVDGLLWFIDEVFP